MTEGLLTLVGGAALGWAFIARSRGADADPGAERGLRACTAMALALAIVSTVTAGTLLLPAVPSASLALRAGLLVFAIFLWPGRRRRPAPALPALTPALPAPRALRSLLAAACVAAIYATVVRLSARPDGAWDAFAFWNARARLLLRASHDASAILSPDLSAPHPDYPLLLPGLVAWSWSIVGEGVTSATAAIALLFGALAGASLFCAISPRRGGTVACLAVLVWLATPHVLRQVSWRYADVPLSAFLVLACGWLAAAYDRPAGAPGAVALAGLCASIGAWTKNEGMVAVLALGFVILARPPVGLARLAALRAFGLGALAFLAVLVAFKIGYAPPNDLVARTESAGALARLTDPSRYGVIARHLFAEFTRSSHWNYLFPGAIVVAAAGPLRGGAPRPVGRALALVGLGYFAVYVLTPQVLVWHLGTSADRLLMQLYPPVLLLAALRLPVPSNPPVSPSPPLRSGIESTLP